MNDHRKAPEKRFDNSTDDPSHWDVPIEIDRPDLPEFPIEQFSGVLGRWILACSHAYQVPCELPALLALAAISGTIQRRIEIQAGRGWIEPCNLYVACLLDPASRKSGVFSEAFRPLRKIEQELIRDCAPEIAKTVAERRIKEKELTALETKASKGDKDSFEAAKKLAVELATNPPPVMPKLILDDATAEAVESSLMAQRGRLIVAGAEGGLFDVMAGRYSGSINLDVFLKSHAGDDLRVDRLSRSVFIERPTLTLAYAVQPEVIRGLADKPAFRGRGLIGRFLYAVPQSNLGSRLIDADGVSVGLQLEFELLFRRLMKLNCSADDPSLVVMSDDAYQAFIEFRNEVETMLADDGRLASLRDWGGKLCGLVARLAAVIHVSRAQSSSPWEIPIDGPTIQCAIEVGRWAIPHAEAAIGLMRAGNGTLDDACYVLQFLRSVGKSKISRRDIGQHGRSRFDGDPKRLDVCLERLVDAGWIRPADSGQKVGRPSLLFDVHPKVGA